MLRVLLFLATVAPLSRAWASPKHIVVCMLENRGFDHYMGLRKGVDGLTPANSWNPANVSDPLRGKVYVSNASYIAPCDGDHSTPGTTAKIFPLSPSDPSMMGFASEEAARGMPDFCSVMTAFTPAQLPVTSFLADNFAIFDRYFSSHPGPTWPNRWFALMGTAAGCLDTGEWYLGETGELYPQRTIFDQMHDAGLTWRYYYGNTPWELNIASVMHNPQNLFQRDAFFADAAAGTLPSFSWLTPRSGMSSDGVGSDDGHPDHDVALEEAFIKDVYDAVRGSPNWNDTLLLFTWDEHGGFYDHVPPPMKGIPDPTLPKERRKDFKWDRLGVRVPLIVVSPLIAPGTVVNRAPAAQKPFPTSEYEHTSIMATARKLLGVREGNLTARDGWAATFEHVLSLPAPRWTPPVAPRAPPPSRDGRAEAELPLNHLQRFMLNTHREISGLRGAHPRRQGDVHGALVRHFERAVQRVARADTAYAAAIIPEPYSGPFPSRFVTDRWVIGDNRVRTATMNVSGIHFCLTMGSNSSSPVGVTLCRAAGIAQALALHMDGTIRPLADLSTCLTVDRLPNSATFGSHALHMRPCVKDDVYQAFGRYTKDVAGGAADGNQVMWGDTVGYLVVLSASAKLKITS